jgi:hypothetical protein
MKDYPGLLKWALNALIYLLFKREAGGEFTYT